MVRFIRAHFHQPVAAFVLRSAFPRTSLGMGHSGRFGRSGYQAAAQQSKRREALRQTPRLTARSTKSYGEVEPGLPRRVWLFFRLL